MSSEVGGLKVAIVGGSIAGCAAAIELTRVGCEVVVYERSTERLEDRGAGISIPTPMIEMLQKRGLVDATWAHIPIQKLPYIYSFKKDGEQIERILRERPGSGGVTNWGVLYHNLRRRVSDEIYHQSHQVTALDELQDGSVRLHFADHQTKVFNLVIFADGHNSLGRQILFPHLSLQYAGYIGWRGLTDERSTSDMSRFEGTLPMFVCPAGLSLLYIVPSHEQAVEIGRRQLNWVFYVKVTEADLATVLTDRRGITHRTSVPPGAVAEVHVAELHYLARQHLPTYMADIICQTKEPFIQAIYDMWVPCYHRGRICLIGDAAMLARPHTGQGTTKAITNAIALADALTTYPSVEAALAAWDEKQRSAGEAVVRQGQRLGQVLVTEAPNWHELDETTLQAWWAEMTDAYASMPRDWEA